ncbi:MAG: DHH family phosphoesterase [Patescibacteria group bacterium]|jgi:phosphoesterase RecJ-like protein
MLNLEQQIVNQLEKSKNILIVFPIDGSGDALASALALFLFLKKTGKEVEIAKSETIETRQSLSFLPAYSEIKDDLSNLRRFIVSVNIHESKINQIKYTIDQDRLNFIISPASGWFKPEDVTTRAGEFKYDLIVTLGTADLESLGELYDTNVEFFYKTTIINIDHQASNEGFGQINLIDLNAVANSEILFYLLKNHKPELITEDIATCLLTGIIQQTKNFKTANLTPRTLLITSQLITLGARREEIVNHLYRSRDISSLKLWGKVLNNLETTENNELLWSKLNNSDFQETGTNNNDLTEVIDELIASVPNAKIIAIFCKEETDKTKIIIFTLKNINALELMKEYAPSGTIRLAQALVNRSLKKTMEEIIPKLQKSLIN